MLEGIFLPFIGTTLGAAGVFFLKKDAKKNLFFQEGLMGIAAGVMLAASIWSLLIPAMEISFVSTLIGLWIGILFVIFLNYVTPKCELMVFTVILHNIPEGMAIGVVYASCLLSDSSISLITAITLSVGIAIQNIPEGAIVSMPLYAHGMRKKKAFAYGVFSGIVEPIAAFLTILLSSLIVPLLPCFLGFAAGAMIGVVIRELLPKSNIGMVLFTVGFSVMMILDVLLG